MPLAEGLGMVRDVQFIERLRMGERLAVIERIEHGALDCAIPVPTLQPLVENVVRHGIADRLRGGTLSVVARVETHAGVRTLVLEVADDGVVADDEAPIAARIARLAEAEGLRVLATCTGGEDALVAIDALAPDIVFLDIRMPGASGLDVLARLKDASDPPARVLVTAHDEREAGLQPSPTAFAAVTKADRAMPASTAALKNASR